MYGVYFTIDSCYCLSSVHFVAVIVFSFRCIDLQMKLGSVYIAIYVLLIVMIFGDDSAKSIYLQDEYAFLY